MAVMREFQSARPHRNAMFFLMRRVDSARFQSARPHRNAMRSVPERRSAALSFNPRVRIGTRCNGFPFDREGAEFQSARPHRNAMAKVDIKDLFCDVS